MSKDCNCNAMDWEGHTFWCKTMDWDGKTHWSSKEAQLSPLDAIKKHIDDELDSIMKYPEMYGGNQAVEMQVLTLLDIQYLGIRLDSDLVDR